MTAKPGVLFVDDEPNILKALRRHVRPFRHDWTVQFADGGVDAMVAIAQGGIDIVVTDMRMPEVDGSRLLEWISENHPGIYRIVLSGEAMPDEICRIVGKSHRFLAKPCPPETLVSVLQQITDTRSRIRAVGDDFGVSMLDNLATPPVFFEELEAALGKDAPDAGEIAQIIRKDASLFLRILQLANSAYFARPLGSCSLKKAVRHIGIDRLQELLGAGRLGQQTRVRIEHESLTEAAYWLANVSQDLCRTLTQDAEMISSAYAAGMALRCGAVEAQSGIGPAARKAAFIAALFGLPARLTDTLRRLSTIDSDIPFESWPRLIADTIIADERPAEQEEEAA